MSDKRTKNILLVGVGGQGTILASKLLTLGLMEEGYDVKMSEIHGMSQRGGSVSSQVRYGEKVWSPVIEKGSADMIVSFEKMEALRWLEYLKKEGLWIACADMKGLDHFDTNMKGPLALVIGSEGDGVSRLVKENCDFTASIPMYGKISSLNASVAAALLMYEVVRQRRF